MGASTSSSSNDSQGISSKAGASNQSANYGQLSQALNQSNQGVWGPQGNALEQTYSGLLNTAQNGLNSMQGQLGGATNLANQQAGGANSALQNLLGGGVYAGVNSAGLLNNSLAQTLNSPTNTQQIYAGVMGGSGNPYVEALTRSLGNQAQNALDLGRAQNAAQAGGAGMSGSSRQGVADALMSRDITDQYLGNVANIGYQSYGQDLANKLGIAQQADSNTLARQQMLSGMMGNQTQTVGNALNLGGQMQGWNSNPITLQGLPTSLAQSTLGSLGGPTVLSSQLGTQQSQGTGNMFGNSYSLGTGIGSMSGESKGMRHGLGGGK